jgi:hypothetical protein
MSTAEVDALVRLFLALTVAVLGLVTVYRVVEDL